MAGAFFAAVWLITCGNKGWQGSKWVKVYYKNDSVARQPKSSHAASRSRRCSAVRFS